MVVWGKRWHHKSLSRMMFRCRMAYYKKRRVLSDALMRFSTGQKNEFLDSKNFPSNLNNGKSEKASQQEISPRQHDNMESTCDDDQMHGREEIRDTTVSFDDDSDICETTESERKSRSGSPADEHVGAGISHEDGFVDSGSVELQRITVDIDLPQKGKNRQSLAVGESETLDNAEYADFMSCPMDDAENSLYDCLFLRPELRPANSNASFTYGELQASHAPAYGDRSTHSEDNYPAASKKTSKRGTTANKKRKQWNDDPDCTLEIGGNAHTDDSHKKRVKNEPSALSVTSCSDNKESAGVFGAICDSRCQNTTSDDLAAEEETGESETLPTDDIKMGQDTNSDIGREHGMNSREEPKNTGIAGPPDMEGNQSFCSANNSHFGCEGEHIDGPQIETDDVASNRREDGPSRLDLSILECYIQSDELTPQDGHHLSFVKSNSENCDNTQSPAKGGAPPFLECGESDDVFPEQNHICKSDLDGAGLSKKTYHSLLERADSDSFVLEPNKTLGDRFLHDLFMERICRSKLYDTLFTQCHELLKNRDCAIELLNMRLQGTITHWNKYVCAPLEKRVAALGPMLDGFVGDCNIAISCLRKNMDMKEKECLGYQARLGDASFVLKSQEDAISHLTKLHGTLKSENAELRGMCCSVVSTVGHAQGSLHRMKDIKNLMLNFFHMKVDDHERLVSHAFDFISTIKNELAILNSDVKANRSRLLDRFRDLVAVVAQNRRDHTDRIAALEMDSQSLETSLKAASTELCDCRHRYDGMCEANKDLAEDIRIKGIYIKELETQLDEILKTNKFYENQLLESDGIIKTLKEANNRSSIDIPAELNKIKKTYFKENALLKLKIEELETELGGKK